MNTSQIQIRSFAGESMNDRDTRASEDLMNLTSCSSRVVMCSFARQYVNASSGAGHVRIVRHSDTSVSISQQCEAREDRHQQELSSEMFGNVSDEQLPDWFKSMPREEQDKMSQPPRRVIQRLHEPHHRHQRQLPYYQPLNPRQVTAPSTYHYSPEDQRRIDHLQAVQREQLRLLLQYHTEVTKAIEAQLGMEYYAMRSQHARELQTLSSNLLRSHVPVCRARHRRHQV